MLRTAVGVLVLVVSLVGCGGGGGGGAPDADLPPSIDANVPIDGPPTDAEGVAPALIGVTPPHGSLIDWRQSIELVFDEPIVDVDVTGSLGAVDLPMPPNATTVRLSPAPTWNDDSDRTLTVIAYDAAGNPSAPVVLSYDVLDGGVRVHPTAGAAGNPGTRSEPLPRIADGIAAADAFYATGEVRVAAATYPEVLTVPTGITVLGGYDPASWSTTPSRHTYPTIIDDLRTGTGPADAVTLSPDSGIERLVVRSAGGVTGTCAAVSLATATGIGSQRIIDTELEARGCTTASAVRATTSLSGLTIDRSDLHGSGAAGTSKMVSLTLDAGPPTGITISNSTIVAHASASAESAGVEVTASATQPALTVTLVNDHVRGGGGSNPSTGRSYGVTLTVPGGTYSIDRSRIHGGTGAVETIGVRAGASGTSTTITRSAIHGGEPQLDDQDATGVSAAGHRAWMWNNLVTGGGRVDASITAGDSIGIRATTTFDAQILNNTVHRGFLSRGGAIALASSGNVHMANNVLFAQGTLAGGFTAAVQELVATADPVSMYRNRVMGFGGGTAMVYMDHVGSAGTGCAGAPEYDCYLAEADLNDESRTTQRGGNSADSNTVGDAGFEDVDGPDGLLHTLFDAAGLIENRWRLTAASPIKAAGRDGSGAFGDYQFGDDYSGTGRTGVAVTPGLGWSIGAYEQDN